MDKHNTIFLRTAFVQNIKKQAVPFAFEEDVAAIIIIQSVDCNPAPSSRRRSLQVGMSKSHIHNPLKRLT